jgi:hypothetical protein
MAINWDTLKTRYLQSNHATQIDSIVLNLTRIQTLANSSSDDQIAQHLVRESQFFIEWTVPTINLTTDITVATELVDLQRQLSHWKLHWEELWANPSDRQQIATQAQEWCQKLSNRPRFSLAS